MRLRVLACAIVMTGTQLSRASFELMYIPSVNDDKIYRFDPSNQVQMGAINSLNPNAVFYTSGRYGSVNSTASGGNHRYDMYSGINQTFLNGSQFSSIGADGTTLFGMSGTTAFSSNLTGSGGIGSTSLSTTFTMLSGYRLSNGNMVGIGTDGSAVRGFLFNSSGTLLDTAGAIVSATVSQTSNSIVTTTNAGAAVFRSVYRDSTGLLRIYHASLSASQNSFVASTGTSINTLTYSSTSVASLAVAHNGYYVVGTDASTVTSTRFTQFNNNGITGTTISAYTIAIDSRVNSGVFSVGMVVAPESGTLAVLGLGLVPFLKRRKRTPSP